MFEVLISYLISVISVAAFAYQVGRRAGILEGYEAGTGKVWTGTGAPRRLRKPSDA